MHIRITLNRTQRKELEELIRNVKPTSESTDPLDELLLESLTFHAFAVTVEGEI